MDISLKKDIMRQINKMLFLSDDWGATETANLHLRLDTALLILGRLQQVDHATSENHFKELLEARMESEQSLKDAVADLVTAFGFDPSDLTFKKLS